MGLFEMFFPEQAQAVHLRNLSQTMVSSMMRSSRGNRHADKRIDEVAEDTAFLALVTFSMLRFLMKKGIVTEEEFKAHLAKLDELDGVRDGELDPAILRGALGLIKEPPPPPAPMARPAPKPRFRKI